MDNKFTGYEIRKIQIAKKMLQARGSSVEEILLEEYEENNSDFSQCLESYIWPNGSWASVDKIFEFYTCSDEVENYGPFLTIEEARSCLGNIEEAYREK